MYYHEIMILTKEIKLLEEKLEFYKKKLSECFKAFFINPKTQEFCNKNDKINKNFSESLIISEKYDKIDDKKEKNKEINGNDENKNEKNKEINDNEENNLNYFQNEIKKKIALKTHPDLIKGKEIFFINALKYIEDDNIFGLIEICQILNIDISTNINKKMYKLIKEQKDKKIEKIESFIAWIWYEKPNLRPQIREIFSKQWNVSIEEIKKQEEEFDN